MGGGVCMLKKKRTTIWSSNSTSHYILKGNENRTLKRFTPMFAAAAKSLQLCPTLCDPIDGSPPGSPVPEILQAKTLEWVAISFSNVWKWKVKVKSLSCVWLLATPWTTAYQAPPSMGFSRQEYWSGVPLSSPTPMFTVVLFTTAMIWKQSMYLPTNRQMDKEVMVYKYIYNGILFSRDKGHLAICDDTYRCWRL